MVALRSQEKDAELLRYPGWQKGCEAVRKARMVRCQEARKSPINCRGAATGVCGGGGERGWSDGCRVGIECQTLGREPSGKENAT